MEKEIVIDTFINHKTFGFENDLVGKKKGDIIKNKTKEIPAILGYFDSVKEYNIEFKIEDILSGKILKADDNKVLKKQDQKQKKKWKKKSKNRLIANLRRQTIRSKAIFYWMKSAKFIVA